MKNQKKIPLDFSFSIHSLDLLETSCRISNLDCVFFFVCYILYICTVQLFLFFYFVLPTTYLVFIFRFATSFKVFQFGFCVINVLIKSKVLMSIMKVSSEPLLY